MSHEGGEGAGAAEEEMVRMRVGGGTEEEAEWGGADEDASFNDCAPSVTALFPPPPPATALSPCFLTTTVFSDPCSCWSPSMCCCSPPWSSRAPTFWRRTSSRQLAMKLRADSPNWL